MNVAVAFAVVAAVVVDCPSALCLQETSLCSCREWTLDFCSLPMFRSRKPVPGNVMQDSESGSEK